MLQPFTGSWTPFKWEQVQQLTFTTLQQVLVSSCVLDYPQKSDCFILTTDAFDVSLGAVFFFTEQGCVVEFASQTLTTAEQKCPTTEKMSSYFVGHSKILPLPMRAHFTHETDYKFLEWLESSCRAKHAHSIWNANL